MNVILCVLVFLMVPLHSTNTFSSKLTYTKSSSSTMPLRFVYRTEQLISLHSLAAQVAQRYLSAVWYTINVNGIVYELLKIIRLLSACQLKVYFLPLFLSFNCFFLKLYYVIDSNKALFFRYFCVICFEWRSRKGVHL